MKDRSAHTAGVRAPAVAGSWYPGDAGALRTLIEELLAAAGGHAGPGPLRALVVPHAGLVYSGPTAAHGYARLAPGRWSRVVVLAPNHRASVRGAAVDPSTHYQTPLGRLAVDAEAVATLAATGACVADPGPFVLEHAIEMQLPFLQVLAPEVRLVPVIVGETRPEDGRRIAAALSAVLDDRTLVVVSSDFTHYGPHYGYVPFTERVPESIEALDTEAIAALTSRDAARFHAHLARTGATICGRRPLGVFLEMVPGDWHGERCAYATSGAITGDYGHSVSYACIAYHGAEEPAKLSGEERQALLFAARQALEALFAPPSVESRVAAVRRTPRLAAPSGAFVTLRRRDGRLRGCIGSLEPRRPLLDSVVESARAAARRDPRFAPLGADEVADVTIEVSVLGGLLPVEDPAAIEIGRDGLVITRGLERGVLLPQVATEHGWDRIQFLENTCCKAGLPPNAWKEGARVERFVAEVVDESEATAGGSPPQAR
jgi:hypothetical protein